MIEHVVFMLEEPSAQDFLMEIAPKLIPQSVHLHYWVFEGKQDLEKQLGRKMRRWLRPNTRFVVMRDQDSADCVAVKSRLRLLCVKAGRQDAIVRIACRELESFFIGDWHAVAEAYAQPRLALLSRQAKYRNPDVFGSPSRELSRLLPGYQKRDGARRISQALDPSRNRSTSFQTLYYTLRTIAQA